MTHYKMVSIDDVSIFYREAGDPNVPTLLLLHGFPTSSHMYRNLIPALADRYHVVAPDLPGFGFSDAPDRAGFKYTFEHLADVIDRFTEVLGLQRYAIYVFDYGAPVGFRLAMRHPERITGIVSQNGNAYEEGLSDGWNPIQRYWREPTPENRVALLDFLKPETTRFQYVHGVPDETKVAPESYTLDSALLARPGNAEIQLDLFLDYRSNVAAYGDFQAYFRVHQPPLLATWGKHDPFFVPAGAEAFKRDLPNADIRFYDTGHFALETRRDRRGDPRLPRPARPLIPTNPFTPFREARPMNKTILVTGASSGFGRDTAETLAAAGHTVFAGLRDIAGRNRAVADALPAEAIEVVDLDVTSDASVDAAVAALLAKSGSRLDVLVNNAGIASAGVSESFTPEQLRALFEVNVFGVQRMLRATLPTLRVTCATAWSSISARSSGA